MTYRFWRFGGVDLPPAMTEDDLGTGDVESTLVDAVGGVFDAWGGGRRLPRKQTINLRGMFELSDGGRFGANHVIYLLDHAGNTVTDHAGNRIITDRDTLALMRDVDALKGVIGVRSRLYRMREYDAEYSWKDARLLKVGYVRTIEDAGAVAHIETVFETAMTGWRANALITVTATVPAPLTITNNGTEVVEDATLVYAPSGTVPSVRITGPGIDLTFNAPVNAGQILSINAGLQTVGANNVSAYANLVRNAGHTAAGWLPIATGTSLLYVDGGPGAGGTVTLTFFEQRI